MCREIALVLSMKGKTMEEFINFLSEWAGWIFGFFATAFAVRGSVNLSVHEIKKESNRKIEQNLQALCPHINCLQSDDGSLVFAHSFFEQTKSNRDVTNYKCYECKLCGYKTNSILEPHRWERYWRENPEAWKKRNKKMQKLAKKLGR